ncbi:Asp23/Gls24 family envelope stress response protein [Herbivorax sp. ANBcel31]|uniref:Asp23/Gls24 family envelope stress response protein n=1 Tax=Herbivorax sp. ANBcel31 TaxID=3069754 RepID=UPI0027AFC8F5|nr:Asp23/Gls24 family envelope stress response protein [Herbivorax sp. ANBcel31]MDQ2085307.1 Asp23/Gls24 family envelope stress response protein [Herbivorax sp. ANBcel31]
MEEADQSNIQNKLTEAGEVRISEEVVAIIAGIAAMDIPGVAGMSGGIAGGIAEMLGRKNLSKGVKVEVGDKEAAIDLYIIVEYGCRIPEVSWDIQERVKDAVEAMTGLNVIEVNIHIQGVNIEKDYKKEPAEEIARVK